MGDTAPNSYKTLPDEAGRFGIHGGRFVAETLMPLILEVEKAYTSTKSDPCLLYTSPSPRDATLSRMPSSA